MIEKLNHFIIEHKRYELKQSNRPKLSTILPRIKLSTTNREVIPPKNQTPYTTNLNHYSKTYIHV